MLKKDGRNIKRDVLEYLRFRAIELWKNGKKPDIISDDFGVSLVTVYRWIGSYKKKGIDGLKKRKAPGAKSKLTPDEIENLLKLLGKTADKYGFETPLWDCKKIQQLISEKFGKKIHNSNIWRFLKRMKLSFQKPQRESIEKDEYEVREWIRTYWPKIKAHAQRWQAMLYFQDESSVQLTSVLGRTWAPKGKTPKVKVTGKRGSICITSAISPAGRLIFRLEKKKINADLHIEFLKQIQKHHPNRKIIVVEDKAPPHIAKKVDYFVESQKKRLAVYNLPSYSPELNPDEHVWAYLKGVKLKTHQVKSLKEFKPLVLSKIRSIQRKSALVSSFFYGELFT